MQPHYIDIRLLPDPEFPTHQLMEALYAKLHRALVVQSSSAIGVCFPGYDGKVPTLGECLRLVGPEANLVQLMRQPWLKGMRDHTSSSALALVPLQAQHRFLRRVQAKSSVERLRRRLMKRHGLTEEEARARIPEDAVRRLRLPFVQVTSRSTGQGFRLFLRQGPLGPTSTAGSFNTYGLSAEASVPHF